MSLSRIIWLNPPTGSQQEIRLDAAVAFLGGEGNMRKHLDQALSLLFDVGESGTTTWDWQEANADAILFEIDGAAGCFVLACLPTKKGLHAYLLNGEYDPSLLMDEAGTLRSEKQLLAEMKRRGLGHSQRLRSPQEVWEQMLPHPRRKKPNRYQWGSSDLRSRYAQLRVATQNERAANEAILRQLLTDPDAAPLALTPLRQALQQMRREKTDWDWLRQQQQAITELVAQAERYQGVQSSLEQQVKELAPIATTFPLLRQRSSQEITRAEQALIAAESQHQLRLEANQQAQEQALRRIGWLSGCLDQSPATFSPSRDLVALQETYQQQRQALLQELRATQDQLVQWQADLTQPPTESMSFPLLNSKVLAARERYAHLSASLAAALTRQKQQETHKQREQDDWKESYEQAEAAHQAQMAAWAAREEALQREMAQSGQSLMAWLEGRYPDWEATIGKVLRPEVLMNPYLSPSVERLNDLLFGVQLDLSELDMPALGEKQLEAEMTQLAEAMEAARKEWQVQQQAFHKQQQQLDKRHRQKALVLQREIQQLRYQAEQAQLTEQRLHQDLRQIWQQQQQRLAQQQLRISYQAEAAQRHQRDLMAQLQELDAQWQLDWEQQCNIELTQATPDPPAREHWETALKQTEEQLMRLRLEAQQQQRDWPALQASLQTQIETAEQYQQALQQADKTWKQVCLAFPQLLGEEGVESSGEEWLPIFLGLGEDLTGWVQGRAQLIRQAQTLAAGLSPDHGLLRGLNMDDIGDALQLSERLTPYQRASTWEQLSHDLTGRYANLVSQLAQETANFDQDPGREARIQAVNRLLGEVTDYRIKLQPGEDPLTRAIQAIQRFAAEQGPALGDQSLFSQGQDRGVSEEAFSLLTQLQAALDHWPGEQLARSDSFSLQVERKAPLSDTWQPWHDWDVSPEQAASTWLSFCLAAWASWPSADTVPLPIPQVLHTEVLPSWATLCEAGNLAACFFQGTADLGPHLQRIYQSKRETEPVTELTLLIS